MLLHYDSQFLTTEDSMSDDVFEMDDDRSSTVTNVISGGLTPATIERSFEKTPSPTGYRDYKPPAEVLSNNYSTTFKTTSDFDSVRSALKKDQERDDNFAHKTILLGDSGVGKTSLLVQFDTGRFQPGNFAATVGIGFTMVSRSVDRHQNDAITPPEVIVAMYEKKGESVYYAQIGVELPDVLITNLTDLRSIL
ncbi:RAB26 protein, partial [Acromyrmex insinuator]